MLIYVVVFYTFLGLKVNLPGIKDDEDDMKKFKIFYSTLKWKTYSEKNNYQVMMMRKMLGKENFILQNPF